MESFKNEKSKVALRHWLLGRKYFKALEAMELGLEYHRGVRKDKVTPEFHHQIAQVNFLSTLESHFLYPEETFIAAFLHDIEEDYQYGLDKIRVQFGDLVADAVALLTKPPDFRKSPDAFNRYFVLSRMHENPIASIVKGVDRIHNQQSGIAIWNREKLLEYIDETKTYILPMIRLARRKNVNQIGAYQNIKTLLLSQVEMIEAICNLTSVDNLPSLT